MSNTPKHKLVTTTINLPEPIRRELDLHADRQYTDLTTVIKRAVVEYLHNHPLPDAVPLHANRR